MSQRSALWVCVCVCAGIEPLYACSLKTNRSENKSWKAAVLHLQCRLVTEMAAVFTVFYLLAIWVELW